MCAMKPGLVNYLCRDGRDIAGDSRMPDSRGSQGGEMFYPLACRTSAVILQSHVLLIRIADAAFASGGLRGLITVQSILILLRMYRSTRSKATWINKINIHPSLRVDLRLLLLRLLLLRLALHRYGIPTMLHLSLLFPLLLRLSRLLFGLLLGFT